MQSNGFRVVGVVVGPGSVAERIKVINIYFITILEQESYPKNYINYFIDILYSLFILFTLIFIDRTFTLIPDSLTAI